MLSISPLGTDLSSIPRLTPFSLPFICSFSNLLSVVAGIPENVSVDASSATSLLVTWDPPLDGEAVRYIVSYAPTGESRLGYSVRSLRLYPVLIVCVFVQHISIVCSNSELCNCMLLLSNGGRTEPLSGLSYGVQFLLLFLGKRTKDSATPCMFMFA